MNTMNNITINNMLNLIFVANVIINVEHISYVKILTYTDDKKPEKLIIQMRNDAIQLDGEAALAFMGKLQKIHDRLELPHAKRNVTLRGSELLL